MILCDTNILIEFYRGNPHILDVLRQVGPAELAISVITAGELYFGAQDKRELHKFKSTFQCCGKSLLMKPFRLFSCRYWENMPRVTN